jgi:sugar lactone lactonase YvrE
MTITMNRSTRLGAALLGCATLLGALALDIAPASAALPTAADIGTVNAYPADTAGVLTSHGNHLWVGNTTSLGRFRYTDHHTYTGWSPPLVSLVRGMTTAADGTIWFTSAGNQRIGRITPNSSATLSMTTYVDPEGEVEVPAGIAEGSDGHIWFADRGSVRIGELDRVTGGITTHTHPDLERPESLIAGPDGNIWFTDAPGYQLGRITPAGQFTFFTTTGLGELGELTVGPDANIWFAARGANSLGRIDPDTGQIKLFSDPTGGVDEPTKVVAAQDCLWLLNAESGGVTRFTTAGAATHFPSEYASDAIRAGDGQLWFTGEDMVHRLQTGYFQPHGFTDVPAGATYGRALNWARSEGVVPDTVTFRPTTPIRRNGIVSMLYAFMDSPTGSPAAGFSDVSAGAPYVAAVDWARAQGVVAAFAGNRFRPGQAVTRLQAATMLWKIAGSPTGNPGHGFSDVGAGNQAVRWAKASLLLRGFPNGTFRPSNTITRSQVAKAVYDLGMNPAAWDATAPSAALF